MTARQFFELLFTNPFFAIGISISLTCLVTALHATGMRQSAAERNAFLRLAKNSAEARTTLFVVGGALIGVCFFGAIGSLDYVAKNPQIDPEATYKGLPLTCYLSSAAILLFFFVQPKWSEKAKLKRECALAAEEERRLIDQAIGSAGKYDFYQGETKVEVFQIMDGLDRLKTSLSAAGKAKGNALAMHEAKEGIATIAAERKEIAGRFQALQSKERAVFAQIGKMEMALFQRAEKETERKLAILRETVKCDIVKAYSMMALEDKPNLKVAK